MLRDEHSNSIDLNADISILRKILILRRFCVSTKKTELLDKEKEHKKYLEDQHCQEVYKQKNEISCLKMELENYKAKPPPTESCLGTYKLKKQETKAHR